MQNLFLSRFRENRKKKVANYFDEEEIEGMKKRERKGHSWHSRLNEDEPPIN